jgi:hypothetical protein
LGPKEVIQLDQPDPSLEDWFAGQEDEVCRTNAGDDRLYANCIARRREFFIDPYGWMTFCDLIKDPALRYDLRRGSFREPWPTGCGAAPNTGKTAAGASCGMTAGGATVTAIWSMAATGPKLRTSARWPGKTGPL